MNSDFRFVMKGRARVALAWVMFFSVSGVHADSYMNLPVACGGGSTCSGVGFTTLSGDGSYLTRSSNAAISNIANNYLTVNQIPQNGIFNWESFNIANGYGVKFQYVDSSGNVINSPFSTLNRIYDVNPSTIFGRIDAPGGTIYLINANGIIFGNGAQVSVGSLVASSLNITDQRFLDGLLSKVDGLTPMFEGSTGFVKVLEGASIITEKNGLVMMLAPTVLNAGTIETPEGQTILGAGQKIWLAASSDPNLRGLVIEVDNPDVTSYTQANAALAKGAEEYRNPEYDMLGAATNLGKIITERGNTTLIGHAVNQRGRISATTSVSLNGSIHLLARDSTISSVASTFSNTKRDPQRAGRVVLGAGSITEILPEDSADTSIDSQAFALSQVNIVGKEIIMESGAGILAPAGVVNIKALANPSKTNLDADTLTAAVAGVRVQFDQGSWIDVAGLTDAAAPVSNNILAVELRGDELKDSPLQRDSFLRGQKVYVDVNKGTPLADISGYESQIGRTARARSTVGGTIKVQSEGEIVFQAGASFDVSGGKITYTPGYVQTTQLISNGKLVDISVANPNVVYDGFADRIIIKDKKWGINETIFIGETLRYDPGYIQGGNAGSVVFQAPALVLNGDLKANTVVGDFQRTAKTAPLGGSLQIGRASSAAIPDYKVQQNVLFDYTQPQLALGFKFGDSLAQSFKDTVVLNPAWFGQGFDRVAVYTNKGVSIVQDAPINLAPGGSFTVRASTADIAGNIVAPSGSIDIQTLATASFKSGDTLDLTVADGVLLSTGGQWVNDFLNPAQAIGSALPDGGAISLSSAHDLTLGSGSVLDADGGAWVGIKGKVQGGAGGDITLKAGNEDNANINTSPYILSLGGELRSYSLKRGGKLTIQAPAKVQIGGVAPAPGSGVYHFDTGFFTRGGFSKFDVSGRKGLTVADSANIDVRMSTLQLQPDYILAANGSNILDYSSVELQPDALRKAADIKLDASDSLSLFGDLVIGAGARIGVDPGGKIDLSASKQLTVYGELSAPAGEIVLTNTTTSTFDATSSIWIASSAKLLAGGVARTTMNNLGLINGEVLDGGSITINADFRYLAVEKGAILDVSGTSAYLDIPTVGGGLGQVVASNAGSISLSAGEGLFFNGTVKAEAGGAQARGGSFSATLDGKRHVFSPLDQLNWPSNDRVLTLGETAAALPAGLIPSGALNASDNGAGSINVKALVDAGVEQMTFKSSGSLVVDNLTVPKSANLRSIVLDAPKIKAQGVADLAASYILAGNTDRRYQTAQAAAAGSAEMWLRGDFVDLIGKFAVNGVSDLHIESASDVRFLGVLPAGSVISNSDRLTGQINLAGNVEFKAAQLYPATRTTFKVDVDAASGGTVTIAPFNANAGLPAAPLSADGELIIRAPNIEQGGTIRAPFGVIDLEAYGKLTATPGSLTSVAALGPDGKPLLIPYGRTDNELSWVYDIGSFSYEVGAVPEKRIRLSGQVLTVADGAQVDISAGGDLQAYEFFSGNGGSIDVLAQKGVYAILPGYTSKFAPWDVMQNSDLKPGDAVYLAGAPGLAAATYTLLPAHYALLPGAYAVRVADKSAGLLPGFGSTQPDGSLIVPGYLTDSRGTARGAWNGFEVISKAIVQTKSEFALNTASNFFPNVLGLTQGLAQEAGRLSLVGQKALKFEGDLIAATVPGYRGAQLDISSNQLAIADASAVLPVGYVTIDPTLLASLPIESVFFGGTRRTVDGVVQIEDVASNVIVDTAAYGKVLAARELMFAATKSITVRDGSELAAYGDVRNDAVVNYAVTGDGALLRLGADTATLTRSGVGSPPKNGDLIVEAGAKLSSSRAAIFDATKNNQVFGTLNFKDGKGKPVAGGALTLGAERISFTGKGVSAPVGTAGLVFDQTQLDNFSALDALNFTSYSGFDFYGAPVLGALDSKKVPLLDKLTLQGAALTGYGGASSVATIQAAAVVFQNPGAALDTSASPANAGELQINATQAIFGAGNKAIRGFKTVTVNADEIVARGVVDVGGTATNTTRVSGDVVLNAGRITGETGASQTLGASGLLTTLQNLLLSALAPATNLGANWTLEGSSVAHGGTVELPSGNVTLHATSGDVEVAGKINAAGIVIPFFDVNVHSPGGTVTLTSDKGKVKILKDALVNVSGTAEADAGTLAVNATNATNGVVEIASDSILGDSTGAASGRFELDVGSLADFSSLNRVLNTGGFHESRKLRVRNGDVTIPASETGKHAVLAHNFQLTADGGDSTTTKKTGNITVTGEVNAAGAKGGFIGLYAKNDVVLESGARLDASASKPGEHGGDIELFSTDGNLNLKSGSTVAASGGAGSWGGTLHLRAKRNSTNNDVQVTALGFTLTGLDKILLEAYKIYVDSSIIAADTGTTSAWYTDAASFMANTNAIEKRLGFDLENKFTSVRLNSKQHQLVSDWLHDASVTQWLKGA
ncbi:MAG: filamentous hemagglutinin N-terminal domain-containing protein [Hydrogenophilales bacterium]|nr:filamentous hemagglutinin N-terminal domain-containing protein [Hydrogenophilales bacterium]